MKNGKNILLLLCAMFLMFVLGVFTGRNTESSYVELKKNDAATVNSTATEAPDYRLDINVATKAQFMELPGIGEVIAERIIIYREVNGSFSTVDELLNVEGIGKTKFQQIETFIRVGG